MHILRVATVYEPLVEKLPDEFRSVLTKQDISLIETGPSYFASLVKPDSPKWLTKLLKECAKVRFELKFQSYNSDAYRPYYHTIWKGEPLISLPREKPLRPDMPDFLKKIYGTIGALRETGFDMAGGLHPGDELVPISETAIWDGHQAPEAYSKAIPFIETLSGGQLCYLLPDGSGAWYESSDLHPVKNLEREVNQYFESLFKGKRL